MQTYVTSCEKIRGGPMLKRMKKISQVSIASIVMLILLMSVPFPTLASSNERVINDAKIVLNGEVEVEKSTLHIKNGRVYLPVGVVVPLMSGSVVWDSETGEATIISKSEDKIVFADEIPTVVINSVRYNLEEAPYFEDGRLYVAARTISELLHAKIEWNLESKTFDITSIPLVKITEEYTVEDLSKEYDVTVKALLNRNGYEAVSDIKVGDELAYIIPSVLSHKAVTYTEEEYKLLAKIVQVEAGYEGYEGQLAVANVILNRVKSNKFPSTIKEVIYSGKQFPPAHNGLLDKATPNKSVLKATRDAMHGKNNIEDAVYFFNPKVTKGSFWSGLETVANIGGHRFSK